MTHFDAMVNHATRAILVKFPGLPNAHAIARCAIGAYNIATDGYTLTPEEKALIKDDLSRAGLVSG